MCGFPKELCICSDLSADEQEIIISNDRRKWGKTVTLVTFQGTFDADLTELLRKFKKKIGAGGTLREKNTIEVQGEHRFALKKFLIDLGYDESRIVLKE